MPAACLPGKDPSCPVMCQNQCISHSPEWGIHTLKGKLPKLPTGAAQIPAGTETEHGEGLCSACPHLTPEQGLRAEGSTQGRQFLLTLHCTFPGATANFTGGGRGGFANA